MGPYKPLRTWVEFPIPYGNVMGVVLQVETSKYGRNMQNSKEGKIEWYPLVIPNIAIAGISPIFNR